MKTDDCIVVCGVLVVAVTICGLLLFYVLAEPDNKVMTMDMYPIEHIEQRTIFSFDRSDKSPSLFFLSSYSESGECCGVLMVWRRSDSSLGSMETYRCGLIPKEGT